MLPKKQRIQRKMFHAGASRVFGNALFVARVFDTGESAARIGFSVSKKISKSAVIRNKLRRMGYRVARGLISLLKPGIAVAISFKKIPKTEEEVTKNLNAILKESKLIK